MNNKLETDVIAMIERIAENGTAPIEGCSLFGVGYDNHIEAIRKMYIDKAFGKGRSAEKFIVGAYGSGKTHFLRQLSEIAREAECVTSEVALNKDLDYTQSLLIYEQVANNLQMKGSTGHGIKTLLESIYVRLKAQSPTVDLEEDFVDRWIGGIPGWDLKNGAFQRVYMIALESLHMGASKKFDTACRWLSGEVTNRNVCKELGEVPVTRADTSIFGKSALLALGQAIRKSTFCGTVIALDEAEQSLSAGLMQSRKREKILSMLQSSVNANSDLEGGALMVLYAITPDVWEKMSEAPMLQQRVADPGPGRGFLDGNPLAKKIPLDEKRGDPEEELYSMGAALVELFYKHHQNDMKNVTREEFLQKTKEVAESVAIEEPSVSSRRLMMKRIATDLLSEYYDFPPSFDPKIEPE